MSNRTTNRLKSPGPSLYQLRNMVQLAYWTLNEIDAPASNRLYDTFGHWSKLTTTTARPALDAYNAAISALDTTK